MNWYCGKCGATNNEIYDYCSYCRHHRNASCLSWNKVVVLGIIIVGVLYFVSQYV